MHRIILIFNFLFISQFSLSIFNPVAGQEILWQNVIGGSGYDEISTLELTTDGGTICGGRSNSNISGDKTEICRGVNDYWVIKSDSLGNVEWEKTIGGSGQDYLKSIIQTPDGGYLCGGYSNSNLSGDKNEPSLGDNDYWVVKLDASGSIQWQNTIGGSASDKLSDVVNAQGGGFICAGTSSSGISGDKTDTCKGNFDYWIIKLDVNGLIEWQKTIGGTDTDECNAISITSDGGYILGGSSASSISADKNENCQGNFDYWIIKIDSLGNIQWQNTIGGVFNDQLFSIKGIPGGGYICGGHSNSPISGDKTVSCSNGGYNNTWVLKLDSIGNIIWQNAFGGTWHVYMYDIRPENDGGFICTVNVWNSAHGIYGDLNEIPMDGLDLWVVKLDSSGSFVWQNLIGGIGSDEAFVAIPLMDGTYIIGGTSSSPVSYDKTETSQGDMDYWILKLTTKFNSITGTNYIDFNSNNTQDAGDVALANQQVSEITTGRFANSNLIGNYSILVLDTGSYTVNAPPLNYYTVSPASNNAVFTDILQNDSLNNFAYTPTGTFNDLCVNISPMGPFRSGFTATYLVSYSNVGNTTLSPTVIFYPDPNVVFSSAVPSPTSIAVDSMVWNLGPLSPFQTGQILVTVNVNSGLAIGSLINSGVAIEPIAGDANPTCNQSYWEVYTTGSFDPNDIIVSHNTLSPTQIANGQYLDYIIRFQNTGNDTAFTVKIINPLDIVKLNVPTFQFVDASHPVTIDWINWERKMEFTFDNILLPDSNVNEPGSHGFIRYRIRPVANLSVGNTIENFALIYFDFNYPVITNTAETDIILQTSIENDATSDIKNVIIYPNPAHNTITIDWNSNAKEASAVILYNLYGQEILTIHPDYPRYSNQKQTIDISELASGVYFIKTSESQAMKFVKW